MVRRPPDEYQQRAIDEAIVAAAWIRWPLPKRLLWLSSFLVLVLTELAGLAVLFGAAGGSYLAAGACAVVVAACMAVGLAVIALAPEAGVRAVVWLSTPRLEDLSSSRGWGTPAIVPPHEPEAAVEDRLARRTHELAQRQEWLSGQLRPPGCGQRSNGTSSQDP